MNILCVIPYAPTALRVRPNNLVRALARLGHAVVLATVWESEADARVLASLRADGLDVTAQRLTRGRSAWEMARAALGGDPLQSRFSWVPELWQALPGLARRADAVHVEHLRGAQYGLSLLRALPADARPPVVWDSVDCITHLFEQARAHRRGWLGRLITAVELPRTRRFEAACARAFDRVLVTSPVDRQALARLAPERAARIEVITNGVDLDAFSPDPGARRDPEAVVFTGKMSYHANVEAARFLVERVMPGVWARRPEAHLVIAGHRPPASLVALASRAAGRVTVTGTVANMRDVLRGATVAAAPLPYGAGVQNKVLEAMACGVPVAATPLAVSALERVEPGRDCLIGETADDLGEAIASLLGDEALRASVGRAGRAYVEAHHDWRVIAAGMAAAYGRARA